MTWPHTVLVWFGHELSWSREFWVLGSAVRAEYRFPNGPPHFLRKTPVQSWPSRRWIFSLMLFQNSINPPCPREAGTCLQRPESIEGTSGPGPGQCCGFYLFLFPSILLYAWSYFRTSKGCFSNLPSRIPAAGNEGLEQLSTLSGKLLSGQGSESFAKRESWVEAALLIFHRWPQWMIY